MQHFRYGATLRPFTQLNLRRLEACELSFAHSPNYAHGTMAFHRKLTDFEANQLDLELLTTANYGCQDDEQGGWD